MKGLLKYLSPFAPDQSGATSVLYDLEGITVICDAGGCTGNICGFDEPRWFEHQSAIFSAGLRDMDAILGRDDRLVDKLKDTAQKVHAKFAAVIGTPVPAVIATDYRALERMGEKRCQMPVIAIECTGTRLYDEGEEKAYLALFRKFAGKDVERDDKAVGIIGMTPLDISLTQGDTFLQEKLQEEGFERIYSYGMGSGLEEVKLAGSVQKNLVVAPAGLKPAKYMEKHFGIPYEVTYPFLGENFLNQLKQISGKKVLIVHQQVAANEIRENIRLSHKGEKMELSVGTWFMQPKDLKEEGDLVFKTEDGFIKHVEEEQYDVIIGDALLHRPLKEFKGIYISIPHFAVSGKLYDGR